MKSAIAGLGLAALLVVTNAHAGPLSFSNLGDTGTINYSGNIEGADVEGLTATTTFRLDQIVDNSFVFDVKIENTANHLWEDARISRIGLNVDPDVIGVSASSPWYAMLGGSVPNGFGAVDMCIGEEKQGGFQCQGGPGGVSKNSVASFLLTMNFETAPAAVWFDNLVVRWQSLTSETLGFNGDSGTGTPVAVPAPGALALLGLGLLGVGLARRLTS